MMATGDWLLLRLPRAAGEAPSRVLVDASGALLPESLIEGAQLRTLAAGRQVALLVPADEVALFSVPLPPGNEARLQQLAPFALEEQVLEDLGDLHFAVGARDAQTGLVPVAVADRARVRQWLTDAAALDVHPKALFAQGDLVPVVAGQVTLVLDAGLVMLRNGVARPVALPADDPELALSTVLGAEADLSQVTLAVYVTPQDWAHAEVAFESLRPRLAALRVHLLADGLLALLAQGIRGSAPVNLLQGAFRPQRTGGVDLHRWRTAAVLLLALVLLHVGASLWELRQLRARAAVLDDEITRVYGSIFPGQQPGATPRRTLDARLRAVAGGGSSMGELMPLLAALSAARQNVPVAALQSMSFRPGALQLRLSAPDAATLEQFSQALRAGGYQAEVTSGRQLEGGFEGQIDMKAGT